MASKYMAKSTLWQNYELMQEFVPVPVIITFDKVPGKKGCYARNNSFPGENKP